MMRRGPQGGKVLNLAEIGRRGGLAAARNRRARLGLAPAIDPAYLAQAATVAYGQAIADLLDARDAAAAAVARGDSAEARRAVRVVAALNAQADRYHDEMQRCLALVQ